MSDIIERIMCNNIIFSYQKHGIGKYLIAVVSCDEVINEGRSVSKFHILTAQNIVTRVLLNHITIKCDCR
jgi:hypothetical protein